MQIVSENKCFDGVQGVYSHQSASCNCEMTFGLYLPPAAEFGNVSLLWFLSGLTCTHENAMVKAGAQAWAAEHGIAVVFPDTSPRGADVADDDEYDLGKGAGFYLDATEAPWAAHFQMSSYILSDLHDLLFEKFPLDVNAQSITGHSMGGHGALTLALKSPGQFTSVSAFAPISNPTASDWGRKQLTAYLGADESKWSAFDASILMRENGFDGPVLIDQGDEDGSWDLLKPEALMTAIGSRKQPATYRLQPGYDHGYFFVSTFMGDHIAFHADALYSR